MKPRVILALSGLIWVVALGHSALRAQTTKSVWDGVYTDAQATRGADTYKTSCVRCHLATLKGKILFFDVGFGAITFFHHVEHLLKDDVPFKVYDDRVFEVSLVDAKGEKRTMRTQAYSKEPRRSAEKLETEMLRRGKIKKGRVGNSRILLMTAEDVVVCQTEMTKAGNAPYDV